MFEFVKRFVRDAGVSDWVYLLAGVFTLLCILLGAVPFGIYVLVFAIWCTGFWSDYIGGE